MHEAKFLLDSIRRLDNDVKGFNKSSQHFLIFTWCVIIAIGAIGILQI